MGNTAKVPARQLWILNISPKACFWTSFSYSSVSIKALTKQGVERVSFGLWSEWLQFLFVVL